MGKRSTQYDEETQRALSLWVVINRAHASITRRAEEDIKKRGFGYTEWSIMEFLYHKGQQPMARLGERILITSGSVTYIVDKLEQRGLVKRQPCQEDRRIVYAVLTEKGRAVMEKEFPEHAEQILALMGVLTPTEQERVKEYLKKLGYAAAREER